MSSVSPAGGDAPLRRTMAAVVADRLRTMILQGELPPGEGPAAREGVRGLADPIREALRQPEVEGLVTNVPQGGVTVATMSAQDLLDLYEFRRLIEPEITARATRAASPGHGRELRAALQRLGDTASGRSSIFGRLARSPVGRHGL